jgi:hypothetical protein
MVEFRELAMSQKLSYSELLREAALYYMKNYKQAKLNEMESSYTKQRKADTNRICGLLGKTSLEVHAILEFLRRMDGGKELVQDCMSVAAKRLESSLDKQVEKIKDQMVKVVEQ